MEQKVAVKTKGGKKGKKKMLKRRNTKVQKGVSQSVDTPSESVSAS